MNIVVFGLSLSSTYANAHAAQWRGLIRALSARGDHVTFFERDLPALAAHRDFVDPPHGRLVLFADFPIPAVRAAIAEADVVIVTSRRPDARAVSLLIGERKGLAVFYDMDAPVTLSRFMAGHEIPYIPRAGLVAYDMVLSQAGGETLARLRFRLDARRTAALFAHADPTLFAPAAPAASRHALACLAAQDEGVQPTRLEQFLIKPAAARTDQRFALAAPDMAHAATQHPNLDWIANCSVAETPARYAAARIALVVARAEMARAGWAPSAGLFEAALCGAPVVTDDWPGLSDFFARGKELLVARGPNDVLAALDLSDAELTRIAEAGRARALAEHTPEARVETLMQLLEYARRAPAAA